MELDLELRLPTLIGSGTVTNILLNKISKYKKGPNLVEN
jgi:hypothetical protein